MPSPKRRRLSLDDDDEDRVALVQKTASSRQLSFGAYPGSTYIRLPHPGSKPSLARVGTTTGIGMRSVARLGAAPAMTRSAIAGIMTRPTTTTRWNTVQFAYPRFITSICLWSRQTVITPCLHSLFCWECIRAWSDQSRKAKLIYNIRSNKDFQTHHLVPLRSPSTSTAAEDHRLLATSSSRPASSTSHRRPSVTSLPRYALYGRRSEADTSPAAGMDEATWREQVNERALERRRFVYRQGLFAKHVASNRYTRFKPFGPDKLNNNAIKNKVLVFVRRELQVFSSVDVAFLTTYILSIASQLDLRSAAAIRLLADFVPQAQAEHLAHEIVTFARSPFDKLEDYDRFVQYGRPEKVEVPRGEERDREREREREPRFGKGVDGRRGWEASNGRYDRGDHDSRWARSDSYDRRVEEGSRSRNRSRDRYDRGNDHRDARRRSPSSAPRSPVLAARPPPRAPSRQSLDRPPSRPSSRRSDLDSTRSTATIEPGVDEGSSDILSLFGTPLRESTPPPTNGVTSSTTHDAPDASAGAAKVSLSIFGIAKSATPIVDTVERTKSKTTIDEVSPVELVSNNSPEPSLTNEVRSAESKRRSSTISREELQSRLMAEYRTALSNKITPPVVAEVYPSSPPPPTPLPPPVVAPSSPPLPKTMTNWAARGQLAARALELKQKLLKNRRLRAESITKSQISPSTKDSPPMIDEAPSRNLPYDEPMIPSKKMIYSEAKRRLVLERLEQEKRLVAQAVSPSSSLLESSTIAFTEDALASEALLRRTLQANKSEKRAAELKERLYKKRLMRESKGKVEGR
ncbi:BZ3500_MvSof-1268-A1-R1_Chr11-1g03175 [Microbotryum saponariae]|uniref:RING-type E3 ubiquitin transferase n=1 Tax=Microbotryum saponariae TaxID=289078 RepID=A0A2X0L7U3_9BASI|nr:BZ3501_MvSof-1269-A2-R1_Chr11g02750 [Microbotryum saponariae]SDA03735.1 BZ3500_MvSof-1268-A1-R1_Chr11-1g03175 [Microbotryum saponariae]